MSKIKPVNWEGLCSICEGEQKKPLSLEKIIDPQISCTTISAIQGETS